MIVDKAEIADKTEIIDKAVIDFNKIAINFIADGFIDFV